MDEQTPLPADLFQSIAKNAVKIVNLTGKQLDTRSTELLASAVRRSSALETLNLATTGLGDQGCELLATSLTGHPSLLALALAENGITDRGAQSLATLVEHHPSLTQLFLAFNSIGPEGAAALATSLSKSPNLATLDLSHNQIGTAGAVAIARALMLEDSASRLRVLQLSGNGIEDEGVRQLALVFEHVTSLKSLYLDKNPIGRAGLTALSEAAWNQPKKKLFAQIGPPPADRTASSSLPQSHLSVPPIFDEQCTSKHSSLGAQP